MKENLVVIILLASAGMLLLVLAVVLFVVTYQRRLLRHQLTLQENEQKHQQELLKSSIDIIEDERRRIAKDLHDEIGASLTTLKIYSGQIKQKLNDAINIEKINLKSRQVIETTIQNVRQITRDLLPATLEHFGLIVALEETCDALKIEPNIQINFRHHLPAQRFEQRLELALYRILRELLNNTIRYAQATEIIIDMQYLASSSKVEVFYQDNGKGFDFQGFASPKGNVGLGLKSIETRVQTIEGLINFESSINQGVEVEISAPVVFAK